MTTSTDIPPRIRELADVLSQPKPMRRGSLSERTVKCGKPGCSCGQDSNARHGPYYSLTRAVEGKTHSRFLSAEQAEVAHQQIEAGRKFRGQVDDYWEACEHWADEQLEGSEAASEEAAKKGGSRRTSKSRSPKKSKRS
jgi:uncharacterized protein DUF6788